MIKNSRGLSLMSLIFTLLTKFMYAQTDSTEVASIYGFYSYSSPLTNASAAPELTLQGNLCTPQQGYSLLRQTLLNWEDYLLAEET